MRGSLRFALPVLCLAFLAGVGLALRHQLFPPRSARPAPERPDATGSEGAGEPQAAPEAISAALRALPYVEGTFDPASDERGVLVHRPDAALAGLNFWASRRRGEAYLMDMEGRLLHRWVYPGATWNHVELLANGDVLGVERDRYLVRLDARSRPLWRRDGGFHHDLWVDGDGTIYALTRRALARPEIHPEAKTLADFITVLSAPGEPLEEISVLDLLERSPYASLVPDLAHLDFGRRKTPPDLDVLHTNHVEVFDGSLAGRSPLFRRGNLLLSLREIDAVAIVDRAEGEIAWLWGPGELVAQHHPTLLASGNLLLFDNGARRSRVIELEPLARRIVWSYGPREGFFSATRGSSQRLPNGNTLVTESDRGYAFEVTPAGEIVWKFANPEVDEKGNRMVIWRMKRFTRAELPFLAAPARPPVPE
jgi:hypothetical protein